jgi:hypothetical protein
MAEANPHELSTRQGNLGAMTGCCEQHESTPALRRLEQVPFRGRTYAEPAPAAEHAMWGQE